jgi:hypothetical protein
MDNIATRCDKKGSWGVVPRRSETGLIVGHSELDVADDGQVKRVFSSKRVLSPVFGTYRSTPAADFERLFCSLLEIPPRVILHDPIEKATHWTAFNMQKIWQGYCTLAVPRIQAKMRFGVYLEAPPVAITSLFSPTGSSVSPSAAVL